MNKMIELRKEFNALVDKYEAEKIAVEEEANAFNDEMFEKYGRGWANKEKVSDWLGIADLISPIHTGNPKLISVAKVIQDFENPKLSKENFEEKDSLLREGQVDNNSQEPRPAETRKPSSKSREAYLSLLRL